MRRTLVTLLLAGLLTTAGLFVASPASACSCMTQTTQQFLDGADAVFTGRLVSREEPPGPLVSSADPAVHVFAVDAVVKGTAHEQQEVLSPMSGATCGLEIAGEGPFVVFATRSGDLGGGAQFATLAQDQYAAFLCGGTAPLTPALETELRSLAGTTTDPVGETTTPPPADAGPTPRPEGSAVPGPVVAAAVLVLAAGTAVLMYRRRSAGRPHP